MIDGKANIQRIYDLADEIDRNEGNLAYKRYRVVCQTIADNYFLPIETVVAVFAALSPNNDYKGNLRSTLSVIEGFQANRRADEITVSTYGHCRNRALSYLSGVSFPATVGGLKILNFYNNILEPENPEFVTIDGHAFNIWNDGKRANLKTVAKVSKAQYKQIAADFRAVALNNGLLPNQLQAATWFCWKRINKIIYKPQLCLFNFHENDTWQTLATLDEITAFKPKGK